MIDETISEIKKDCEIQAVFNYMVVEWTRRFHAYRKAAYA